MDRDELRRRLLLRLFGSPITLLPALGGIVAATSPLLFPIDWGIPLFLGVLGISTAVGSLAFRGTVRREAIAGQILADLEAEAVQQRRKQLNLLKTRLKSDDDTRDENVLEDLLGLVEAVREDDSWRAGINVVAAADILVGIDELFDTSVASLQRCVELRDMAQKLNTPEASAHLMAEREVLLGEIQQSVRALTALVTDLRVLGSGGAKHADRFSSLRKNLDRSLEAARRSGNEVADLTSDSSTRSARARAQSARKETP